MSDYLVSAYTIVLLDTGPLGLISNPSSSSAALECNLWLESLLLQGIRVYLPEIADYEVRRELIRAGKTAGIKRLDDFKALLLYLPLTTEAMLQAAEFWAQARRSGRPTSDPHALDGDAILAAQAATLNIDGADPVIATTNVSHLSLFVPAYHWRNIHL